MNILFLSIGDIPNIQHREIYPDLLREFIKKGHHVYVVCARERRNNAPTELIEENGATLLKVRIGNIKKTNYVEKGISTLLINSQFKTAMKRHFSGVRFDLVIYSTPPITLVDCIEYVKKTSGAVSYLLLKDIFPQNALDLGVLTKTGIAAPIYYYFREKEKKLYQVSDYIGCMSQNNVDYVLRHNSFVDPKKVEVCPNSAEPVDLSIERETRDRIREKYGVPVDRKVFVYGGNLGKPQGIEFLIRCVRSVKKEDIFFLIIGDGTEYHKIADYIEQEAPSHVKLIRQLPKADYERIVSSSDIGMIFLDHRFTIPNFPSRLLSYLQARLPVLIMSDKNTDVGKIALEGGFGYWAESDCEEHFSALIDSFLQSDLREMGENGYRYFHEHYTAEKSCDIILKRVCNK